MIVTKSPKKVNRTSNTSHMESVQRSTTAKKVRKSAKKSINEEQMMPVEDIPQQEEAEGEQTPLQEQTPNAS